MLELKNNVNTLIDQFDIFATELTRVALDVSIGGQFGGQVNIPGATGVWRDLTDNVNTVLTNLTDQFRSISEMVTAIAKGDFSKKLKINCYGEVLELKDTINMFVDQLNSFASQVMFVARGIGTEGNFGLQAQVMGTAGMWMEIIDYFNTMAANLTGQFRSVSQMVTYFASGDISSKMTIDCKGETLELKDTINTMVDYLENFSSEVTRVICEMVYKGKLGGPANVRGMGGIWKDIMDYVNNIWENATMFESEMARVTLEVGYAGILGGQANVKKKEISTKKYT